MEFFATTKSPWDAQQLQEQITPARLPHFCSAISTTLESDAQGGRYHTDWGEFVISWQPIRGGLRMSMPTCPNVLSWSLTTGLPPDPSQLVVHATINRTEHDPDFIESLDEFVDAWIAGILSHC
ncbi:hypothetical protein Mmc1_1408 [Magnetococcus marinus MC-1]|uniref:Uncharacterized protein n=1 Tax=Magnetococcus marinus (strain ATCC BAA-1437 / JCM 17883 / MC-1) TaxID=156889 RepID=A0L7H6_MAGMM|nr:hypothetical protein [Magnetococcus marinus]ABK43919.1 hypothetical protein Mmc1_1408 [Magnetococcus marinus MC-1]